MSRTEGDKANGEKLIISQEGEFMMLDEKVPEFLEKEKNIINQPPFIWIWQQDYMPSDFFGDLSGEKLELSRAHFVQAVMHRNWMTEANSLQVRRSLENVNLAYKSGSGWESRPVFEIARRTKEFLSTFPFMKEYIFMHWPINWKQSNYDGDGKFRSWGPLPLSYAAYAAQNLIAQDSLKWIGLETELPSLSSTEDIKAALPQGRGRVNRYYRLVQHSEALK